MAPADALVSVAAPMLVEAAKLGLQVWFTNMRMTGKTEEEIAALYEQERAQFVKNTPDKLEDV